MANIKMESLLRATSDEVATGFIAWLGQTSGSRGVHVDTNRKRIARHLSAPYTTRFHTERLSGSYNLFDRRGIEEVEHTLSLLEETAAFQATRRINGGNGYFQNAFNKYRAFWMFLADGGEILREGLESSARMWEEVKNRLSMEVED